MKFDAPKPLSASQRQASRDWEDYARIKRDHGDLTAFLFAEVIGLAGNSQNVIGLSEPNKHSILDRD